MSLKRYEDIVYNHALAPVSGAAVTVTGLSSLASLFDDLGNPIANPVITDGNGGFFFYVAAGYYTLTINGGAPPISPVVVEHITIPADGIDGHDGHDGVDGAPGAPGPPGADGAPGPAPSGSANQVLATPNGAPGVSALRSLVAADIPAISVPWGNLTGVPAFATVATSGSYLDLSNKPTIPAAQINSDWNAVAGLAQILNKPTTWAWANLTGVPSFAAVATSGAYADLSGQPVLAATLAAVSHKFVVSYDSTTGAFTAAQPDYGDLTGVPTIPTSFPWNVEGNAAADLTLANAGFASTFQQTSAVNWTWANITAATNLGVNQSSPILNLTGQYFGAGISKNDTWSIQNVVGNGKSVTITNVAETVGNIVTLNCVNTFGVGDVVSFTGLTVATWLNAQQVNVTTVSGTVITFTDPTSHGSGVGVTNSTPETGKVTQANVVPTLVFTHVGSPSATTGNVMIPTVSPQIQLPNLGAQNNQYGTYYPMLYGSTAGNLTGISIGEDATEPLTVCSPQGQTFIYFTQLGVVQFGLGGNAGSSAAGLATFFSSPDGGCINIKGSESTQVVRPCVNFGNNQSLIATSGTQVGVSAGSTEVTAVSALTFAPTYGTASFVALRTNPTINQVAITGNIAGVQVVTNVVTVVFLTNAGLTNGATNVIATAVTNTAVNGTVSLTSSVNRTNVSISNIVETAGNAVTLTVGAHNMVANDYVYLTGLTTGTWLNGKVAKITSVVANSTITFTDPTSHGTQATHADTGTVNSSYVTYAKTTANLTLTTDTGTVLQQGSGSYTGFKIAIVETALGGTANKLIDCYAGSAGTTAMFSVDNKGVVKLSGTAATVSSGTGSPETVVTAPIGSLFTRTDGGAATTLYVKESGAGNTGWIAK